MNFQNDIVDHETQGDNQIFSLNKIKTKKVIFILFINLTILLIIKIII
jgi:hypothetical protein